MSRFDEHGNHIFMWAFAEKNIYEKIKMTRAMTQLSDKGLSSDIIHEQKLLSLNDLPPARDVDVLPLRFHPAKKGFSSVEGQARMLHDLANIELQAMELGLRTLCDFPDSPEAFKEELYNIILSESDHLEMCLLEIEKLGFKWGDWPAHVALWNATSSKDSLLDRILIVHRYLEGSGLDAGDTLIRRLRGVDSKTILLAVERINREEVEHVLFGSEWYVKICSLEGLDPNEDYFTRMRALKWVLPKRMEPINVELRKKAGFTDNEIQYLQNLRDSFLKNLKQ
ncbi:MAG: DUF455 family protein [Pseudobdellovibrio sp.]